MILFIFSSLILITFVFRRTLIRLLLPWLLQKLMRKVYEQHQTQQKPSQDTSTPKKPQKHSYAEDIEFEELDD